MKEALLKNIIIAVMLLFTTASLESQEKREIELTAQEILARVDNILDYPEGLLKGKLIHITPDGRSKVIDLVGSISEDDYLFKFISRKRGEELKILYNLRGEDIWAYNILSIKLFNKRGVDKYNPILNTNYYFIDLSNADLQSNYTARITGEAFVKGKDSLKLKLRPVMRGSNYGLLTLYVTKDKYIPLRIDYHDQDTVIFKTLSIAKVMTRNNRIVPIRYDMLDIRRGTVTILEFFGFEEGMRFDKKIFIHQNMGNEE